MRKGLKSNESRLFLTPAAAQSAAGAIEAQMRSFKDVEIQIRVDGASLTMCFEGPPTSGGSARACAKRLAEWLASLHKI